MYGVYVVFVVFLYCNLLQLTMVEGLLLPFLYILVHTCVIFNKCIHTLKHHVAYLGICKAVSLHVQAVRHYAGLHALALRKM